MTLFKVNYADFFICMAGGSHQVAEVLVFGIFQASFMTGTVLFLLRLDRTTVRTPKTQAKLYSVNSVIPKRSL